MAKGFFYQNNSKLVVLKDKRKLLADIDAAIRNAPVKAKKHRTLYEAFIVSVRYGEGSMSSFGFSEAEAKSKIVKMKKNECVGINEIQVPVSSVEFDVGGNCNVKIFNEKVHLIEFRKRVEKTQETWRRPVVKARKTFSHRPTAARQESIGELVKVNRKGWFTDGHVLIKGEVPKGKEAKGKQVDVSDIIKNMAYDNTRPAELQYYYMDHEIGKAVSKNPVLQLGANNVLRPSHPYVVFKIDGRYVVYLQGVFRAVKNRYPGAEYRIYPDAGMLGAYEKQKLVALLMPYQAGGRYHERYPTQMYVPPLRDEAIKAGFLKEKRKTLEI